MNARKEGMIVIHVRAEYTRKDSKWMSTWDELIGTSGRGVLGEVYSTTVSDFAKETSEELVIGKNSFDGFYNTELENVLNEHNVKELFVAGILTSCCVLFTAVSIYNTH